MVKKHGKQKAFNKKHFKCAPPPHASGGTVKMKKIHGRATTTKQIKLIGKLAKTYNTDYQTHENTYEIVGKLGVRWVRGVRGRALTPLGPFGAVCVIPSCG